MSMVQLKRQAALFLGCLTSTDRLPVLFLLLLLLFFFLVILLVIILILLSLTLAVILTLNTSTNTRNPMRVLLQVLGQPQKPSSHQF